MRLFSFVVFAAVVYTLAYAAYWLVVCVERLHAYGVLHY